MAVRGRSFDAIETHSPLKLILREFEPVREEDSHTPFFEIGDVCNSGGGTKRPSSIGECTVVRDTGLLASRPRYIVDVWSAS
jgi:hypothetical protein